MLSALFVNDVVCLVMAPIVLDLVRRLRLPPAPYLIALATAANVGSVATLTGNPQNMLVGSFSGISYRAFLLREAPVAVIGLALVFAVIWLAYRRRLPPALPAAPPRRARGGAPRADDQDDRRGVGDAGGVPRRACRSRWWPSAAPPTVCSRGG